MPDDPKLYRDRFQAIIDKLVAAGWLDRAIIVDSTPEKRGKIATRFTKRGSDAMFAFKSVHDHLGEFSDEERHALYDLLILWILESPERYGIEPFHD